MTRKTLALPVFLLLAAGTVSAQSSVTLNIMGQQVRLEADPTLVALRVQPADVANVTRQESFTSRFQIVEGSWPKLRSVGARHPAVAGRCHAIGHKHFREISSSR